MPDKTQKWRGGVGCAARRCNGCPENFRTILAVVAGPSPARRIIEWKARLMGGAGDIGDGACALVAWAGNIRDELQRESTRTGGADAQS